jgi:argininosuccinate synthase
MSEGSGKIDPTRMSVEQAAKLLSAAYRERIEPEKIQLDLQTGAPVNVDGTINLVHYSAWQAKEMGRGD